ncbi:MAG TPA: hypothetical protein VGJ79_14285 [Candidatus Dormibacteraeota bacterium]
MKLMVTLTAVMALALVACGSHVDYGPGGAVPISPPVGALTGWASFPADQKPRPIVWLQNSSPANGYGTGNAKLAAICSKYALAVTLPTSIPSGAVATWTDGTSATYRGISASVALGALSANQTTSQDPQCTSIPPLVINAARLGTFDFVTDRGQAQMTAWLFSGIGVNGEIAYPAIVRTAFWKGGVLLQVAMASTVMSADGRSLTFTFYGAPSDPGPCGADYKAVVAESQAAVAIALQATSHAKPGQMVACDLMAQQRSVVVTLAQALGGRVVLDGSGNVTGVCPSTRPDC